MLELTGLTKAYDGFEFGPVDLTVDDEVLAVLGPSGSGKTTLLSLIAGIVRPDAGSITLDGRRLDGRPVEDRRTGLVFQEGALFPHMTARENVGYAATDPDRVEKLAALLEIADVLDRRPSTLSGGERQRVALARTLAADPDALLLDEPLSSLDAPIRRRLRGELRALFDSLDIPVVYVTHDQRTASALGDRLAIFRDGRVEQCGEPSAVIERPETPFVARFTGNENLFEATVVDRTAGETTVRVGDVTLRTAGAPGSTAAAGSTVTVCVHPSRIELHGADGTATADGSRAVNFLSGRVTRRLNEGADCRVSVDVDGAPVTLVAVVRPATVERLGLEPGALVRLDLPAESIHLLA